MTVTAVFRAPFELTPVVCQMEPRQTLEDMAARMPGLSSDFAAHGTICVEGHPVPRQAWRTIRPLAGRPVEVTFHAPPRGGDGGKNPLALIASIALLGAATFLSGGGAAGLLGAKFAEGALGARLLGAGTLLVGNAVLAGLTGPPVPSNSGENTPRDRDRSAAARGNQLAPDASIPRVVGEIMVFPPFATQPLVYQDVEDEIVEVIYCLAGPHQMSDIRINNTPIGEIEDVEVELRTGQPGDKQLERFSRQSVSRDVRSELRGHVTFEGDGKTLEPSTSSISSALPQPFVMSTDTDADQFDIAMAWAQGLSINADDGVPIRVPLRLRMREVGTSAWKNLPELHFQAAAIKQIRATIRLFFGKREVILSGGRPRSQGFVEARHTAPGQTLLPASSGWVADASFIGAGNTYLGSNNAASSGVLGVELGKYGVDITLDETAFPKGRYEVEIIRGFSFRESEYSVANYKVQGQVRDLFGYEGTTDRKIVVSRNGKQDATYVQRTASIWNEHPVPTDDFALIGIRARNRQIDTLSCVAGGIVNDWDGTAWANPVVTDNPAPHVRDIYAGQLNADPLPVDLLDDDGLVEWRQACIDSGYTCNAIIDGESVFDAARIVASCGYARPYMSDIWGVTRDYDRTGETPIQIFTPRNSSGFSVSKGFADIPEALRVTFTDKLRDYEERQVTVYRAGFSGSGGKVEPATFEGFVNEADMVRRAKFDLAQFEARNAFFDLTVPAEAIVCRRGSLVGLQTDVLVKQSGSARISGVEDDEDGFVTGLWLDSEVPALDEPGFLDIGDMSTVEDVSLIGAQTGVVIRTARGPTVAYRPSVSSAASRHLTFDPPLDNDNIAVGQLLVAGRTTQEYRRVIVTDIRPAADLTASLTLVDEAPELFA